MKALRVLLALLMLVTAVMPSLALACARGCDQARLLPVTAMSDDHCANSDAAKPAPADSGAAHLLDQGPLCQLAVGVTLNSLALVSAFAAPAVHSLEPHAVFPFSPTHPPYRPPMA